MKHIVFQGDSITDARRARDVEEYLGSGYPTMVAGDLGVKYPGVYSCVNRGVSGNRIVDVYARIKIDCWNLEPDILSLLIGINDVWHEVGDNHNGVDAVRFEKMYRILVEDTKERFPDIKILVLEPFVLPGAATEAKWDVFSREVPLRAAASKRVAEDYGLIFVPLQSVFDEACRLAPADWWLRDGVHPTAHGHRLIADAWEKAAAENGILA